ncbi:MAG: ribbon-helix-helix protein, CopG family [Alphaproteobacteria bacterium]|jgi:predicted transcriptional regulator|nr:ribbon-helix-helix protein, CopG family [Alphaproteobacteria bacterium]MDP6814168.1 ribbon-helix-helix protein, CopG family [Alphaproteobacteria bacterium]
MPAITVRIPDDTARQIDELAEAMERNRTWVVTAALKRYLAEESQWLERVKAGRAAIARGEGIPHEDVMAGLRARIADHQD